MCQRLGSASQPGFGSDPGSACLVEVPGGGRKKKRSCIHKPIPKAEGVISETHMKEVESLLTVDMNDIVKRGRTKVQETWNTLKFHICDFVVSCDMSAVMMEKEALQRTFGRKKARRLIL